MKSKNILNRAKVYLSGPMEFDEKGQSWREFVKATLEPQGIICLDPYNKQFSNVVIDESNEAKERLIKLREKGDFVPLAKACKEFRRFDLAMVDRADFLIVYLDKTLYTVGTFEELFEANKSRKPCYVVFNQGKKNAPLWLFGTVPEKYIFSSVKDCLIEILGINDGTKKMDNKRWRLLKEDIR